MTPTQPESALVNVSAKWLDWPADDHTRPRLQPRPLKCKESVL